MSLFDDYWYQSEDGLRLYARHYNVAQSKLCLLCMHGLTRNSADFEDICEQLGPNYQIVAVDQRGRGKSEWDTEPQNYQPLVYVQDMLQLIDTLQLKNVVLVGTSMGGIMAMLMNAMRPGTFLGVIINDVGPVIDTEGLDRIKRYTGNQPTATNWDEAIANTRDINGIAFPDQPDEFWQSFAKRLYSENTQGVPQLLYDPAISQPFSAMKSDATAQDLWPAFEPLATVPLLVIRGELSDLLSRDTVAEMIKRKPDTQAVVIPQVGHAPILNESEAIGAITQFLSEIT